MSETPGGAPTCSSCIHWDGTPQPFKFVVDTDDAPYEEPLPGEWGECARILHRKSGFDQTLKTEVAFLSDGSGYYASLSTRAEFGCVLWEPSLTPNPTEP